MSRMRTIKKKVSTAPRGRPTGSTNYLSSAIRELNVGSSLIIPPSLTSENTVRCTVNRLRQENPRLTTGKTTSGNMVVRNRTKREMS